ncbi:MAG: hypothetical protein IJ515_05795 [Clostridia bacterium]|nr:hypothetical protein [Clostridia bacterium]
MEMEINCAYNHGINVFIYDWYWYDNRPFLENCLNDGYLKAKNKKNTTKNTELTSATISTSTERFHLFNQQANATKHHRICIPEE